MLTGILAHAVPVPRPLRRSDREQLNLAAHNLLRHAAGRIGFDLVRSDFNSPIVDARALNPAIWEREGPLRGIELDLDAQLRLIEEQRAPFIAEFRPIARPGEPVGTDRWTRTSCTRCSATPRPRACSRSAPATPRS